MQEKIQEKPQVEEETQQKEVHFNKVDIIGSLVIGELSAWLLYVIGRVNAAELPLPAGVVNTFSTLQGALMLAVALPILSVIGLYVAYFLAKFVKIIYQAAKFALVGVLNTFVDLGILNLFILFTGISAGATYSMFKGVSFIVAALNSYAWNKWWTFESRKEKIGKEFTQFMIVSVIGFFLNVGTASILVNVIGPQFGIAAAPWASVGALAGTIVVFVWNFVGYKFWVFRTDS